MVKDIKSGAGNSNPQELVNFNGSLFFQAYDGVHGFELWKSDGTETGTIMLTDVDPGTDGSYPAHFVDVNGTLYFEANDGTAGYELWKSDGTDAGTVMVKDINSGSGSSSPTSLTNLSGLLFFPADDGINGIELWKSDGTAAGTAMIKDINSGSGSSNPNYLANVNGTLFFQADDSTHGADLWAVRPPAAVAGDYTVKQNQQVDLSASASSDPDPSETLTYQWDLDGDGLYGETGSAAARGDETGQTPTFNAEGLTPADYAVSLRVTDSTGLSDTAGGTITVTASPILALGAGAGAGPEVRVMRGNEPELSFYAFDPSFRGGVDVAVGDVNGDGVGDIIAGAGAGGSGHVRVFSGTDGSQIAGPLGSFLAFPGVGGSTADASSSYYTAAFNGPIHVAAGDVNNDGHADVIVSVGADGPPQVKIFSGADGSLLGSFLVFPDSSHADPFDPAYFTSAFQGGVNVAAGDINADGKDDLIAAAGPGAEPHVKVFAGGQASDLIRSFEAYDSSFAGGVNVSAGDVNGDGTDDILTAPQSGAAPNVKAFSGAGGAQLASFYAYDPAFRGGVHLAGGDYDGDGQFDLFTAPGAGASSDVRRFTFDTGHAANTTEDFFAFDQAFLGGATVAM
jgi:ELWxxDGT repeat protein